LLVVNILILTVGNTIGNLELNKAAHSLYISGGWHVQFVPWKIPLDGIFAPFTSCSVLPSILVRDDLTIPPKVDELIREDASVAASVTVIVRHALPWDDCGQTLGSTSSNPPLASWTGLVPDG
jgi:hypothetical protein